MGKDRCFSAEALRATFGHLGIVALLLTSTHVIQGQQGPPVSELLQQFEREGIFWRQFDVAQAIVAANDLSVLPRLESWLTHQDRHLRGNAAFIFSKLGDRRGFDVIVALLSDRSEARKVHSIASDGRPYLQGQIREDRYYAAHLLGDLKDARAVPILVPLLTDADINYIVPWSLGQIGDRSAIPALIETLNDPNPSMRVLAIYALTELKASEALPRLRRLLDDHVRSDFGKLESVAEAAQAAIAALQSKTAR
ncbi:MAG TPA: HEAT repeat domain-containing protein [Bryobacteraceae bacterium]|nr:HEAT repeat domain-containing protein [Bryobacteraceae bacterium]